ncbi:hypothetical protein AAE02nite_47810 [Adhaeribacter aerolatus]|uniref:Uncharacterized protein n=1 Tax=Adhaeribacter aerolatus TaxID=670289 RepID=A0A512B5R4_9BACT|nr:hypothetical protein [Adhaeribacter aerolatus]GEO07117.1 hypothetical protein AAE02nite_47810 [Adhaeribacter aerolatus]
MRPLIAILLLLVYTCTGTTFRQLQQAPVLVEHFREHQIMDKEINFFEFLARHYLNGNAKDADYTRDQQLPLKSNDFIVSTTAGFFMPAFFPILNFNYPALIPDYGQVPNDNFRPSQFLSQIWQPPKSC